MIELGDEVKDTVTGFAGIAIARHTYLHGGNRITVQPPIDTNGEMNEAVVFDEAQLEVVKSNGKGIGFIEVKK